MSIAPHPWWFGLQVWAFPHVALALLPPMLAAGYAHRWRLSIRRSAALILGVGILLWASRQGMALGLRYWGYWGLLGRWWAWCRWSGSAALATSAALTWLAWRRLSASQARGTPPNFALQRTPPAAAVLVESKVAQAGGSAELWR